MCACVPLCHLDRPLVNEIGIDIVCLFDPGLTFLDNFDYSKSLLYLHKIYVCIVQRATLSRRITEPLVKLKINYL